MAIKKNDPPKKGKTTLGAGTGSGITKYSAENAKQKAIKEAARKSAAAAMRKPAPKKAAAPKKPVAPAMNKAAAPAMNKAAAPAPAPKKPSTINKRAPLMNVDLGKNKKGMAYTMSIDTTNMKKPDEQTYNYIMRDSTGKVTSKGNLASNQGSFGKGEARYLVGQYKARAKK
jgi:hypothetical protein